MIHPMSEWNIRDAYLHLDVNPVLYWIFREFKKQWWTCFFTVHLLQ